MAIQVLDFDKYEVRGAESGRRKLGVLSTSSNPAADVTLNSLELAQALAGDSGGTGVKTFKKGDILVASGDGVWTLLGAAPAGYVLTAQGKSRMPAYNNPDLPTIRARLDALEDHMVTSQGQFVRTAGGEPVYA